MQECPKFSCLSDVLASGILPKAESCQGITVNMNRNPASALKFLMLLLLLWA